MTDLDRLFTPASIALVGASDDPRKISGRPYTYLRKHGYEGDVYLVNPNHDTLEGRICYDSVTDIPNTVDVAMLLVPAAVTPAVVEECGKHDIPFAIVVASGFAETDDRGSDLESRLLSAATEHDVRLVGPNSQGLINLTDVVPLSFSSSLNRESLIPGNVSFVTQSGAFGGALFQLTQELGVGMSKWLSTGNETDLSTVDFIDYLVEDPHSDVVVSYIESLSDGERLQAIGRRAVTTETAIVAMRVGSSPTGKEAASSHTGSIATDDEIYDAVFKQAGIATVESVDEFVDTVTAFSRVSPNRYPSVSRSEGRGLGVISVSGGAAVLIADVCDRTGLPLTTFNNETEATIRKVIPAYGSATNPVDVTGSVIGDSDLLERCLQVIAEDPGVEALLLQFGNSGGETIESIKGLLLATVASSDIPICTVFTGGRPSDATAAELREHGILLFEDPVRAVTTIDKLGERESFLTKVPSLPPLAVEPQRYALPLSTSWETIETEFMNRGVTFAPSQLVSDVDDTLAAAETLGYPVALKLNPLEADHKSEIGGVKIDLDSSDAVRGAFDALENGNRDTDILVQPMVDGIEVIIGVVADSDFGPVMLFGPGGVFVELFDDFAYRAIPVSEDMAREMINETVVSRLLDGFRDLPPGDIDALAAFMANLSTAYQELDVTELECNPVIVNQDGAFSIDLLVK